MKNNIYFLIRSLLISLLIPSFSFAQSLAPIPDVGEGVCVSNCGGNTTPDIPTIPSSSEDTDTTSMPPSILQEEAIQAVQNNIQNATELDNQALRKIDEGDYPAVPPLIDDAVESLTDAKDSLKTDPELEQLREDEPNALSKIDRSLQSSINNHKKVSSTVDRIVNDPKVDENEGLLSRLIKRTKKFLSDAINKDRRTESRFTNCCVAAVRG